MDIRVVEGNIAEIEASAVVVNIFEGVTEPGGAAAEIDKKLDGAITALVADGEIKGKRGEFTLIHTLGRLPATRVVVAGLGKSDDLTLDVVRGVAGGAGRFVRSKHVASFASVLHGAGAGGIDAEDCAQAMAEGTVMGLYRFDKYKSKSDTDPVEEITLVTLSGDGIGQIESRVEKGEIIAEAVALCRDMSNEPANTMTPTAMAEHALEVARDTGMEIEVLDRDKMAELGMGSLLGVAQGSSEPPKLIVLKYHGDPDDEDNSLGILGKGITFDSGGLDIKGAAGMLTMKGDMAGGASIIGAMGAIARIKPKVNVVGIVPATENMPGGKAQRPGDVVRAMNGKTIEIGNTDAEGRLVLADAVCYARSLGLTRLVDVATLTGAVVVALGDLAIGAFGNNREWTDRIIEAGANVGERIWELPTYPEYQRQYRSDIADIKNTGERGGGAITGAMIIGEFADDAAWAHLDIAGTAKTSRNSGYTPKGATGTPVRTLVELAESVSSS
ncbi:MAG: leucyl aminopeptidase [SAR202 cluster bacterium]|jgi:leucyl aminopeptidase|nr:leucyl aminopeptidase [SAR202 cluster bacterium]MDP6801062.1 leucyl aminopeptidase [SAR202 cluster bacterium]MQG58896.1 leucyl aminopeptidase [SAR202 cluster bacterium]MQG69018.1 leucyl aminopeptidase [SAR202 cluster bacterium]|tara:strand:- start:2159 stop:3661 length:1503 start_codon:yes stop_codon:yes gene_type:complete